MFWGELTDSSARKEALITRRAGIASAVKPLLHSLPGTHAAAIADRADRLLCPTRRDDSGLCVSGTSNGINLCACGASGGRGCGGDRKSVV